MKIEIWSDVVCPFCYIGKRKLETALQQFEGKDSVEIIWKSFQLNPNETYQPGVDLATNLAKSKGQSIAWAQNAIQYVTQMAAQEGLQYNFDIAVVNNSLDAHRLGHFATQKGLGNEAAEAIFKAYFTEGKNIGDAETLANIGASIGLDKSEVLKMLASEYFKKEVQQDIYEARLLNVSGVPFFVFNGKQAISGAQHTSVFLNTLKKSFQDWKSEQVENPFEIIQGSVCKPAEECK